MHLGKHWNRNEDVSSPDSMANLQRTPPFHTYVYLYFPHFRLCVPFSIRILTIFFLTEHSSRFAFSRGSGHSSHYLTFGARYERVEFVGSTYFWAENSGSSTFSWQLGTDSFVPIVIHIHVYSESPGNSLYISSSSLSVLQRREWFGQPFGPKACPFHSDCSY